MISQAPKIFSAPPQKVAFSALLFDMDGTIIDSTEAVVKNWHRFVFQLDLFPFHATSFKFQTLV
jgi:beta-phosphoglucomutase-like phosphatase (HAD superfamily)